MDAYENDLVAAMWEGFALEMAKADAAILDFLPLEGEDYDPNAKVEERDEDAMWDEDQRIDGAFIERGWY